MLWGRCPSHSVRPAPCNPVQRQSMTGKRTDSDDTQPSPSGGNEADSAQHSPSYSPLVVPSAIRKRYAAKFGVSLLLVLVVIALVGAVGILQAEAVVQESTEDQLRETSELRAHSIGTFVDRMQLQVRTASAGKPLQNGANRSRYLRLESDRTTDDVLAFHLVDGRRGTVEASTVAPMKGTTLRSLETPWAGANVPSGPGNETAVWRSDRSYRSPVFDDEPVIAFASPVPGQPGQYLVAIARVQNHLDTIESKRTNERTTIINRAGKPVLQPDTNFGTSVHSQHVRAVRESRITTSDVDDKFVHAYAAVPGTDWVAITTVDKQSAFAVQRQVRANVSVIIGAALVALGGVGFVLWRQTVTPLSELRDRAMQMEAGDLSVELETERVDEIGRLYQSLANMRDELAAQIMESERNREQAERHALEAEEARSEAEALAEQLKEQKQRSDEQFRTLFQTAPDPVVMVSKDGTIENVNPAFGAVFGCDTEEVAGTEFVDVGFEPTERVCEIADTFQSDDPEAVSGETYTLTYDRGQGEAATIELNADLLVDDGAVLGWVGILRDITERERQRQKLEEKNDRLEQFTSIVSHDLRNPLNVASGYVEIARDRDTKDDVEPLLEIESAHDRMYQLIDELLTLAQQGQTITDTTTVDPAEIAKDAWETVETSEATLEVPDTIGMVDADPGRLSQLFENLFRNAMDHNTGDVTIMVGPLPEDDGFFIADDGTGIPDCKRDAVFEHGYTTATDGTGFGLSIVDQIASAHGWTIESVESEAGGARFEIRHSDRPTTPPPDQH